DAMAVPTRATVCAICVGIPAAWAVSRAERRLDVALYAVVATYMLPPVALGVPVYMGLSALGMLNSVFSLAIIYLSILAPFTAWLLKSSFDNIQIELEHATTIVCASLD